MKALVKQALLTILGTVILTTISAQHRFFLERDGGDGLPNISTYVALGDSTIYATGNWLSDNLADPVTGQFLAYDSSGTILGEFHEPNMGDFSRVVHHQGVNYFTALEVTRWDGFGGSFKVYAKRDDASEVFTLTLDTDHYGEDEYYSASVHRARDGFFITYGVTFPDDPFWRTYRGRAFIRKYDLDWNFQWESEVIAPEGEITNVAAVEPHPQGGYDIFYETVFVDQDDIRHHTGKLIAAHFSEIGEVTTRFITDAYPGIDDRQSLTRTTNSSSLNRLPNGNYVHFLPSSGIYYPLHRGSLRCVTPTGELVWEYRMDEQFPESLEIIEPTQPEFGDFAVLGNGTIAIVGGITPHFFTPRGYKGSLILLDQEGQRIKRHQFVVRSRHEEAFGYSDVHPQSTIYNAFFDVAEHPSGDLILVGLRGDFSGYGPDGQNQHYSTDALLVRLPPDGCFTPDCAVEQLIGPNPIPPAMVVPGKRWTERTYFENGDSLDRQYRISPDSVFVNHRYYQAIQEYDPHSGEYVNTQDSIRELLGKIFIRRGGADYLVSDAYLEEGWRMTGPYYFPGNSPTADITQDVIRRDSVTTLDGTRRLRITYDCEYVGIDPFYPGPYEWIEGVGRLDGVNSLFRACVQPRTTELLCAFEGDRQIYQHPRLNDCGILDAITDPPAIDFSIYPNPGPGAFHVDVPGRLEEITVHSLDGRLLLRTNEATFDLRGQPAGNYLCRVVTRDGVGTRMLVKQ